MMAEDNLEFHDPTWLPKGNEATNVVVPDITDENNFIIVNPEEIGIAGLNYISLFSYFYTVSCIFKNDGN